MEYRCDITNKFTLFADDENEVCDPNDILSKIQDPSQKVKSKKDKANAKLVAKNLEKEKEKENQTKIVPKKVETNTRPQRSETNNRAPRFNTQQRQRDDNSAKQTSNVEESDTAPERPRRDFPSTRGRGGSSYRGPRRDENRDAEHQNGNDKIQRGGYRQAPMKRFDERRNRYEQQNGNNEQTVGSNDAATKNVASNEDPAKNDVQGAVEDEKKVETTESGENTEEAAAEPAQMTLDEFKALEEQRRAKASFNIRKAGEGCNDPKWKQMHVLKKKVEEEEEEEYEEESEDNEEDTKTKNKLAIKFQFYDDQARRGARRGRGGATDTRGDRVYEPNQRKQREAPVPNVLDVEDFPRLS